MTSNCNTSGIDTLMITFSTFGVLEALLVFLPIIYNAVGKGGTCFICGSVITVVIAVLYVHISRNATQPKEGDLK